MQALQKELNDAQRSMKRYQKLRWLCRWQAITSLCDSLESVLVLLGAANDDGDDLDLTLYTKLRTFKFVYCLYFLADILHRLSRLSKVFQHKFVDVSSIGSVIRTGVTSLQLMFITDSTNMNAHTFNDDAGYHILLDFGPDEGFLKRLPSKICGSKYHDMDMVRDRLGRDLKEVLAFQRYFTEPVIVALEVRFVDNNLMGYFKILSPANMPAKQVGLKSWDVIELQSIVEHYGFDCVIGSKPFHAIVDVVTVKREFLTFKIQVTSEWQKKPFHELWTMVSWNPTLQLKYSNLLVVEYISCVQCVSSAQCECAFSIQNCIKTKFCNWLQTKNLDLSCILH